MRKAELEAHQAMFASLERTIGENLTTRDFGKVFSASIECFPHIGPTINLRKQIGAEPVTPELLSFKVICEYGPPLFEHAAIDSLIDFIKATRLLARHENGYSEEAEAARTREKLARSIWNRIERHPDLLQRDLGRELGCDQGAAVGIVDTWEKLGIISRRPEQNCYALSFCSSLDAEVDGMCPECGARGKGRKELFFKPTVCKRCGMAGYYHLSSSH